MTLPSFIDVVQVESSISVQGLNQSGSKITISEFTSFNVLSSPPNPDNGDLVLAQDQKGVKLNGATGINPSSFISSPLASMNVLDDGSNFTFTINSSKNVISDQLTVEPSLPTFNQGVFWA